MKILLSLLMLFAIGCADNDDDNGIADVPATEPPNVAASIPELVGTWSKACLPFDNSDHDHDDDEIDHIGDDLEEGFRRSVITVQNNTLQIQELAFRHRSTCVGVPEVDARANFSFNVPAFIPGQVNSMDLTMQQVLAKINSAPAVALANAAGLCGFRDWQVSVDKDVTGRNCLVDLPNTGEPFFQIFQVNPTQLFIGSLNSQQNGRTPESRPTVLDPVPYTR